MDCHINYLLIISFTTDCYQLKITDKLKTNNYNFMAFKDNYYYLILI